MKNFRFHLFFLILFFLDQITKLIFHARDFFFGPVHVHPVKNSGLAFSLNFGPLVNLILIAIALVIFVNYYFKNQKQFSILQKFGGVLIFAGAIGNIFDRLYLGYVRDFLDLGLGFTFNLADVFVLIGLIIIFLFNSPVE